MEEVGQFAVEKTTKDIDDFACELCDSRFKNVRALRTHKGRAHKANTGSPITQLDGHSGKLEARMTKNDNENKSSDEENSCDVCDFIGKTPAELKTHKTTKHLFGRIKGFSRW